MRNFRTVTRLGLCIMWGGSDDSDALAAGIFSDSPTKSFNAPFAHCG